MKQYVIDQLRGTDYERIREYLLANAEKTFMEDMYWVSLPERLYTDVQKAADAIDGLRLLGLREDDIQISQGVPHSARIWNYWLGGKDNYAPDREIGDFFIRDSAGDALMKVSSAGDVVATRDITAQGDLAGTRASPGR